MPEALRGLLAFSAFFTTSLVKGCDDMERHIVDVHANSKAEALAALEILIEKIADYDDGPIETYCACTNEGNVQS